MRIEQRLLGRCHLQEDRRALPVASLRQLQQADQRCDVFFLLGALLLQRAARDQGVVDIAQRRDHCALITGDQFALASLRQLDLASHRPAGKQRLRQTAGAGPGERRPLEQLRQLRALQAQEPGQADPWKVGGPRNADVGVGGDQALLGLAYVRPARQQVGRQAGRHRRNRELAEVAATLDRPRAAAGQHADQVLLLSDLPLQRRNRGRRDLVLRFCLPHVAFGRHAAFEA